VTPRLASDLLDYFERLDAFLAEQEDIDEISDGYGNNTEAVLNEAGKLRRELEVSWNGGRGLVERVEREGQDDPAGCPAGHGEQCCRDHAACLAVLAGGE
jgi:hypothetical protein